MEGESSFEFFQPGLQSKFFATFKKMKRKGEGVDVTIKCGKKVFLAHRFVLSAAVPYFRTLFAHSPSLSEKPVVTMSLLDPDAVECLIDYAYTNRVTITKANAVSLLLSSEVLQITDVRDRCCQFVSKHLSRKDVIRSLRILKNLNYRNFARIVDTYIREDFDAVCRRAPCSFVFDFTVRKGDLSKTGVSEAARRWLEAADTYIREDFDAVIRKAQLTFVSALTTKADLSKVEVSEAARKWLQVESERIGYLSTLLLDGVGMHLPSPWLTTRTGREKLVRNLIPYRDSVHLKKTVANLKSFSFKHNRWEATTLKHRACISASSGGQNGQANALKYSRVCCGLQRGHSTPHISMLNAFPAGLRKAVRNDWSNNSNSKNESFDNSEDESVNWDDESDDTWKSSKAECMELYVQSSKCRKRFGNGGYRRRASCNTRKFQRTITYSCDTDYDEYDDSDYEEYDDFELNTVYMSAVHSLCSPSYHESYRSINIESRK